MAQMLQILLLFLATFTPKATAEKPGPLTVTVDPKYIPFLNVRHFDMYLEQLEEGKEFDGLQCKKPTLLSTNPLEFTLDWSKCPRAVERPEQLWYLKITIEVLYKGGRQQREAIWLKNYSSGFHRRIFGGGKARLVKFLKTTFGNLHELPKLVYMEDPTGIPIPPAGTLTFNVEYQHRVVSSIRHVKVTHASNVRVEMGECQPENVMGGKFALDLAKCNVHDLRDFMNLQMVLRVALQKGQHPNRVEGRTELVKFVMLSNAPKEVLHQLYSGAHQLNLLLSEQYKPMITLNGQHWANVQQSSLASSSSQSHPQQHAGASSSAHSHALQLVPKTQEEINAQEASAGYYMGRKMNSSIAFFIPSKILKGPRRVVIHEGEAIFVYSRDIKLVNDEQHKMRIWHPDGDECPVEIAGDFTVISAVLDIDWNKCTPNPIKSHEELEGMELVVYYQLDKDEPKQIRHTFKRDEPLQSVFYGTIVGRLELFENGSVKFMQNH